MKLKNLFSLMVLGTTLTITAVGCKTKPHNPTPLPNAFNVPKDPNAVGIGNGPQIDLGNSNPLPQPVVTQQGIAPNNPGSHDNWVADPTALKAQTVYFDYDKSSVKTSEQSKLEDVANYLKGNPVAAVRVEGNCDERGTEEYNRALGERRALAAREYLVRLGVDATRVDTISYGEDKPAEPGHNETAWSKNRRDEFVVLTPPKP